VSFYYTWQLFVYQSLTVKPPPDKVLEAMLAEHQAECWDGA